MTRLLLVEDEDVIRRELRRLLSRSGYDVVEADTVRAAAAELATSAFDVILADVRLPGGAGTELLGRTGGAPVIMMTSYATVRSAVEAMKLGAADYVPKPFDHETLLGVIERAVRHEPRAADATRRDRGEGAEDPGLEAIVGESALVRDLRERIARAAPTDLAVLVLGESGTGKELVARALHAGSRRRARPFVVVNCAAIPESLIESELFGYEKGAFTGAAAAHAGLVEAAEGGTLFLDEIGELPPPAQARLLRVLQEKEVRRIGATHVLRVDVRLVAATHRDLPLMVQQGSFRGDLYFRLRVVELRVPTLAERGEDLFVLARQMLERVCAREQRPCVTLSGEARAAMRAHAWPGNVRELEHAIERALVFTDGDVIGTSALGLDRTLPQPAPGAPKSGVPGASASAPSLEDAPSLEEYFRRFVLEHQGRLSETELARRLGISRKTLWERRQRFSLPRNKG
jgi:DNA-binding NtrC family response regulator